MRLCGPVLPVMLGVLHVCMESVFLCLFSTFIFVIFVLEHFSRVEGGFVLLLLFSSGTFPESIQKRTRLHALLKGAAHDIIALAHRLCDPNSVSGACCSSSCYPNRTSGRVFACAL